MLYALFERWFEGRHYAYENPLFRGTCAALVAFLLALTTMPRVVRLLMRWKLGDQPEFDHAILNELMRGKRDVPTMGGILIVGSIVVTTLLLTDLSNFYVHMALTALIWLGALGGADDWLKLTRERRSGTRDGLKFHEKILFQVGLGVVLGFFIYNHGRTNLAVLSPLVGSGEVPAYQVLTIPFYKPGVQLGVLGFMIVTVLVMTATSNAVNLTDGMDGLASGCVAWCGLVFALLTYVVGTETLAHKLLLAYVPGSAELVVMCGALVGSALGFLWYNCPPARVFMGDTGSLPIGGLIGFVAVVTRQELMLLIAGGVFVMEAVSVIAQVAYFKWTGGRRLLRCAPLHHHFHLCGWTEPQTVVRFWLMSAMFAGCALATIKLR